MRKIHKPCRHGNRYIFTYRFRDGKRNLRWELYDPSHERFFKGANDPKLPQEALIPPLSPKQIQNTNRPLRIKFHGSLFFGVLAGKREPCMGPL